MKVSIKEAQRIHYIIKLKKKLIKLKALTMTEALPANVCTKLFTCINNHIGWTLTYKMH